MGKSNDYEKFLKKLAGRIKELRLERGLTQEDMTQFGFNYRHYQKLESGTHSPSLETIFKLGKGFRVPCSYFFQD